MLSRYACWGVVAYICIQSWRLPCAGVALQRSSTVRAVEESDYHRTQESQTRNNTCMSALRLSAVLGSTCQSDSENGKHKPNQTTTRSSTLPLHVSAARVLVAPVYSPATYSAWPPPLPFPLQTRHTPKRDTSQVKKLRRTLRAPFCEESVLPVSELIFLSSDLCCAAAARRCAV